ncbi:MAG: formate dehydrogenase accessory sulfurtransferase FdhD [Solirubrobacterales bacterium]|nr:formate dehydrogenase accessory sulfurtransferase FdhD [Solirubrobacterales bacterium]
MTGSPETLLEWKDRHFSYAVRTEERCGLRAALSKLVRSISDGDDRRRTRNCWRSIRRPRRSGWRPVMVRGQLDAVQESGSGRRAEALTEPHECRNHGGHNDGRCTCTERFPPTWPCADRRLHAAGLLVADGVLVGGRADVGRHNAMDKVIGWCL